KSAARGSAGGDRAATGPARRAEERRQGAHGGTTSGGAYHRDHEGGRGGLATRGAAPVLVLEPGDVGLGHRKPTAMGRRRAAAPPPRDRALRIARSAQGRACCASIAGVSAVTTRGLFRLRFRGPAQQIRMEMEPCATGKTLAGFSFWQSAPIQSLLSFPSDCTNMAKSKLGVNGYIS